MNFTSLHSKMTIKELDQLFTHFLNERWEEVLKENEEELTRLFPEYEDATYGMYLDKLLPPLWKEMRKHGFQTAAQTEENDFVIAGCLHFRNSMEKASWGKPEHERRVFWIVIENEDNRMIGTLLFHLSHSHLQFHLPSAPAIQSIEGTDRPVIIEQIQKLITAS